MAKKINAGRSNLKLSRLYLFTELKQIVLIFIKLGFLQKTFFLEVKAYVLYII